MVYDKMSSDLNGDIFFHLGEEVIAVIGHYYLLNDYVYICEIDGNLEPFFVRIRYNTNDKEEQYNIFLAVVEAYILHITEDRNCTCRVITHGYIKIAEDPLSLINHVTINSNPLALVLRGKMDSDGEGRTTVCLQSKDGSIYGVDIMDEKLIAVVADNQSKLDKLGLWVSVAYEQWRKNYASEKTRSTISTRLT